MTNASCESSCGQAGTGIEALPHLKQVAPDAAIALPAAEPGTLDGPAMIVVDELRDAVERRPVPVASHDLAVNVGVGWALWQGEDEEELLERADRALYATKHSSGDLSGEAVQ